MGASNPLEAVPLSVFQEGARVPLDAVIASDELKRRPRRPRDYEAENEAILALMSEMASATGITGADRVLQRLVEAAMRLCRSHSAGVSLLERDGERQIFRWRAIAGSWRHFLGGTIARDASPCGTVVDRNMPMLMQHPELHYPFGEAPAIAELLLIPIHHDGQNIGTLWVIADDETRRFDAEDERLMTGLSRFASAGYQLLIAQELKKELRVRQAAEHRLTADIRERERTEAAARVVQDRLETELADARLLHAISAELITEDDVPALYDKILTAAVRIMRSDCASMQMFVDEPSGGALSLIAHRGFDAEAAAYWANVYCTTSSTCAEVLRTRKRIVARHIADEPYMAGSDELNVYLKGGIQAVQSTPLVSRSGRLVGAISTHWKFPHEPEERDLRLFDILARQAADLVERRQAEERLRESDRRKDEFLATLAHELRNPLAPIRNAVQILQLPAPPDHDVAWAREVIDRQTHHLARLVDDLLDVSRITRGRLELRTERVELKRILQIAMETSQQAIAAGGHRVSVSSPPQSVYVEADPSRLAQVFANLLNNAAKFSESPGTIVVRVDLEEPGVAVVRVRDEGIGIPADALPVIFDLFTQPHSSLVHDRSGLGVGLALVRRLVEMHGGIVTAHSEGLGRGSEFVVTLPVAPPDRAGIRVADPPPAVASTRRRVLVVDDYPDGVTSMCRLLRIMGYEAHMARDGLEGFAMAERVRPDVALLDIGMPKLDGYALARRIREQPWGKSMTLIAVTGWGQDSDKMRSADAGFDHHLTKPVSPDELTELIEPRSF